MTEREYNVISFLSFDFLFYARIHERVASRTIRFRTGNRMETAAKRYNGEKMGHHICACNLALIVILLTHYNPRSVFIYYFIHVVS